jgi:hypothetical protein
MSPKPKKYALCWHSGPEGGFRCEYHDDERRARDEFKKLSADTNKMLIDMHQQFNEALETRKQEALRVMRRYSFSALEYKYLSSWAPNPLKPRLFHLVTDTQNNATLLLKPVRRHLRNETIEASAEFCSKMRDLINDPENAFGGVNLMSFRALPSENTEGAWICAHVLPKSPSIAELFSSCLGNDGSNINMAAEEQQRRMVKRVMLARAIGTLHAASEKPNLLSLIADTNTTYEHYLCDNSEYMRLRNVLNNEKPIDVEDICDRIAGLSRNIATTNDMQCKNVVVSNIATQSDLYPDYDHLTIVNCECLVRLNALWELVWIAVLGDECSGFFSANSAGERKPIDAATIGQEFAWALSVYRLYRCGNSTIGKAKLFSKEEVELFPEMLIMKLLWISGVVPAGDPRGPETLAAAWRICKDDDLKKALQAAVESIAEPDAIWNQVSLSPSLIDGPEGEFIYPQLFPVLERVFDSHFSSTRSSSDLGLFNKKPLELLLVHYNGTFAPVHEGHFETLLHGVANAGSLFKGVCVGGFFSPCSDSCMNDKLKEDSKLFPSATVRIPLLIAATYSQWLEASRRNGDNPDRPVLFVDTWETKFYKPQDLRRLDVRSETFKRTVDVCLRRWCELHSPSRTPDVKTCLVALMGSDIANQAFRFMEHSKNKKLGLRCIITKRSSDIKEEEINRIAALEAKYADSIKSLGCPSRIKRSSTDVRTALQSGDSKKILEFVGIPSVAARLAVSYPRIG